MRKRSQTLSLAMVVGSLAIVAAFVSPVHATPILISDWDDGSLQGWTPGEDPFGGQLFLSMTGGNPDGYLYAVDEAAGGGLLVHAPEVLSGDLSIHHGLWWDEYVQDDGVNTLNSTAIFLLGPDNTWFHSDWALGPVEVWRTKYASFDDPDGWTLIGGTKTFEEVLRDVQGLFVMLDTSIGVLEAGIDNVTLDAGSAAVPEPATLLLMGSGLAGLAWRVGRRRPSC